MQLVGEGDIEGTQLLPWQQLHQGSVAALDICTETRQVLHMGCPPQIWAYVDIHTDRVLPIRVDSCERAALQRATMAILPLVRMQALASLSRPGSICAGSDSWR